MLCEWKPNTVIIIINNNTSSSISLSLLHYHALILYKIINYDNSLPLNIGKDIFSSFQNNTSTTY